MKNTAGSPQCHVRMRQPKTGIEQSPVLRRIRTVHKNLPHSMKQIAARDLDFHISYGIEVIAEPVGFYRPPIDRFYLQFYELDQRIGERARHRFTCHESSPS